MFPNVSRKQPAVSTPAYSFTFNRLSNAVRYKSRAITRYVLTGPAYLIVVLYAQSLFPVNEKNVMQSAERITAKRINLCAC